MSPNHPARALLLAIPVAAVVAGGAAAFAQGGPAPNAPDQPTGCAWQSLGSATQARFHPASAFDTDQNRFYVYGGMDEALDVKSTVGAVDLSAASLSGATHRPVSAPGAAERYGAAGAYRSAGDKSAVYFLGGSRSPTDGRGENSVQVYDPAKGTWTQLNAGGTFEDRVFHAAAWDPAHDVIVAVGGVNACALPGGVPCRASSFGTSFLMLADPMGPRWVRGPATGPSTLYGHTLVHDPAGQRMLAYGGTRDGNRAESTLWELDLADPDPTKATWSQLATVGGGPTGLAFHAAALDRARGWMVVYGGTTTGFMTGSESAGAKAFALDLGASPPQWRDLGASLGERVGGAMGYDPLHAAVIHHGGRSEFRVGANQSVGRDSAALVCAAVPNQTATPGATVTAGATGTTGPTSTAGATATPGTPVGTSTATAVPPTMTLPPPGTPTATTRPATATGTARPATGTPPPVPTVPGVMACPRLTNRVPAAAINAALAAPDRVYGYNLRCNPNREPHPFFNPPRRWLGLRNPNIPYHPVYNGLVFKCGCQ